MNPGSLWRLVRARQSGRAPPVPTRPCGKIRPSRGLPAAPLRGCEELGANVRQRRRGRWAKGGGISYPQFEATPLRRAPAPCAPRRAALWGAVLGPRPQLVPPSGCRHRGHGPSHPAAGPGRSVLSAGAAAPPAGHLALAGLRRRRRPARRGPDGGRGRCEPGCALSARLLASRRPSPSRPAAARGAAL